jgi:hypothetical protein
MKKVIITIIIFSCCYTVSFAQANDTATKKKLQEISFDLCGFSSNILSKNIWGGNLDFKYYLTKKWALGISFSGAQKSITDTFTFTIKDPIIDYYEVGIINQYEVLQTKKMRLGFDINNGILIARLGDNAFKERYGRAYQSKKIASNILYMLQVGVNFSYRIINGNHQPDFYLISKIKYRLAAGSTQYAQANDFSNLYFGIGVSLIGFSNYK